MIASQPMTPYQTASLYVGDLHPEATESTLFEKFNAVGPVASIRVCRDSVNRVSLGYAYVNFHNVQDADRALDTMNFTEILNKPCRIMWSQRDPSLRKTGQNNIFVRNLAPTVDNKGLYDTFSVFGNILSCKVVTDDKGVSKGYGYVHFETTDAAQDAISKFDGMMIDDFEVKVSLFVRKQDRGTQNVWTNVYLKQFPATWDEQFIRDLVSPFGAVVSVHLSRDEEGKSKGFAFVNFETHEAAERSVAELNGRVFDDVSLYVGRAQKKAERQRELKAKQDSYNLERMSKSQGKNLYVKNVDDAVSDEVFRAAFAVYGPITSAKIMRDRDTNASKGFGFVCFESQDDAAKAVQEMNNTLLGGKPLFVALYQKKEQRRAALAANYSPQNMHRFQGGAQGGAMPFMGMYMGQQPGGPPGAFPGGRGGAQGGAQFAPRGPGGFGGRGGFRGNNNMGGANGPAQGFSPAQGGFGYKGGAPRGAPQGFGGPGYFNQQNRRPMGGPQGQGMGQQPGPMGAMGHQAPRGAVMPPGAPRGFPSQQPMGPPGHQGMMMMQYPPGAAMMMIPRGPPNGPPQQMMQMPPMAPQGVKFTAQARNQNAVGGPAVPAPGVVPVPQGGQQKLDFSELLLKEQDPQRQKNLIGEQLYPLIEQHQPQLAGKITGMLLEMDNGELLNLIESPEALLAKIEEALTVLRNHSRAQGM